MNLEILTPGKQNFTAAKSHGVPNAGASTGRLELVRVLEIQAAPLVSALNAGQTEDLKRQTKLIWL
jgi:hypothetical protein